MTSPFGFRPEDRGSFNALDAIINDNPRDAEKELDIEKPREARKSSATSRLSQSSPSSIESPPDFEGSSSSKRHSHRLSGAFKGRGHSRKTSDLTDLLCDAAAQGDAAYIGRILGAGGDFKKRNSEGLAPLHVAVMANASEAVRVLVRMGADIESRDALGCSPLDRAVMSGHVALVSHLVHLGADVNRMDGKGQAPIHIAASMRKAGTHVENTSRRNSRQEGTLRFSYAAADGHSRRPSNGSGSGRSYDDCTIIEALVRAGADVDLKNREGDAPLHIAVRVGSVDNVRLLLDNHANVNIRNDSNQTPLAMLAGSDRRDDAISALLLDRGAEVTTLEEKTRRRSRFGKTLGVHGS